MSNIHIQGDGNAVGNGNRIFVDKRTIHNQNSSSDRKGKDTDAFSLGAAVLAALAIAAWKFAQYAPAIYLGLKLTAVVLVAVQLATTTALADQPPTWRRYQVISIMAAVLAGLGAWMSEASYRFELTQLAQTQSWKTFWCGLSPYGGQLATHHMLTMSMFSVPAFIFASMYAIGGVGRWLWFKKNLPMFARMGQLQKDAIAQTAVVLGLLCFLSQLDVSQQLWAELYETRIANGMHWLCPP